MEPLALRAVVRKHQRAADLTVDLHGRRRLRLHCGTDKQNARANGRGDLRFTKLH
jgi:hypothetical protein